MSNSVRKFALGASVLALVGIASSQAAAQPQPSPSARDYDNRIRQQARSGTLNGPPPSQYDAAGNRIIQEGPAWVRNSTPEQREQIYDTMRSNGERMIHPLQRDMGDLNNWARTNSDRFNTDADTLMRSFDPAQANAPDRQAMLNDPNYARNLSHSMVQTLRNVGELDSTLGQTIHPVMTGFSPGVAPVLQDLERIARANGASEAEIRELQQAQRDLNGRVPVAIERVFNQHETDMRRAMTNIADNQEQIEARVTTAIQGIINQYGPDPARWPQAARQQLNNSLPSVPAPVYANAAGDLGLGGVVNPLRPATNAIARATTPIPPTPAAAAGRQPSPSGNGQANAGPPAAATGTGRSGSTQTASRGTTRGNGAGTQGDLSQGPRVPRSQGGTGAETPASSAAARARAQQQADAQARAAEQRRAEAQAERTERLRQAAMAQARREDRGESNDPLDNLGRRREPNETPPPGEHEGWDVPNVGMPPPGAQGEDGGSRGAAAAAAALLRAAAEAAGRTGTGGFSPNDPRRRGMLGRIGGGPTGGSGAGDLGGILIAVDTVRDVEVEQRAVAEAAARETARLADERARLAAAAQRRTAQDQRWRDMVDASFRTFQSPGWGAFDDLDPLQRGALYDAVWEAFDRNGGSLTTLELEDIYRNYNPLNSIPPAQSLSSAPRSLSAAGRSLSAAGTPVRSGTDDYDDPAVQSLYDALYHLTQRRRSPLGPSEDDIQTANFGDYDLYSDPTGRWGRESGGYVAASLFSEELDYLSRSFVNGRNGLQGLLAQPFNVLLTWGQGGNDLDLHMTGPSGLGSTDRFHIYYAAPGNLASFPFAALIRDCICRSGSEVILTSNLLGGGVYRVSVFNFGDQAANSNNLSNASEARIQIVRGGVAVAQGNGTTIQGGRLILDTRVPVGQFGNTWVAVELDPRTGRITVPARIVQTEGSPNVR